MGIPVEIPGLDTLIPELEEGKIVVVESGADPAKSFFVRRMCITAMHRGWPVTFITSRDEGEVKQLFSAESPPSMEPPVEPLILERDEVNDLPEFGGRGGLVAVDSFSFLTLGLDAPLLAEMMRNLRAQCRGKSTTVILGTDRGMFEPRAEAVTSHLSDGMLQFHAREGPEGLNRFLRIPKWMGGRFVDRNVYYDFDGRRLVIDLRQRVI
jgi:KaiC/GvpD/RAD55 family RecA-like ATPase